MKEATRIAFWRELARLWGENNKIVVLDADLSSSTKTSEFAKLFPNRFFNAGISEQDMVWMAWWLAVAGFIPVCASFAIFATGRAWEQMRNTVCYSNLPVKLVGTHAGILTWEDGATHQALEDIALMRSIPNISIVQPADAIETESALRKIIDLEWPVYLRLGRDPVHIVNDRNYQFNFGKNVILYNSWDDIWIFASWATVGHALIAAEKLNEIWIKSRVINISSIKPLDKMNILDVCTKSENVVTVEDHSIIGGIGSAVAEVIAEYWIWCKLTRLWMTTFWESWTSDDLYAKFKLDCDWILESIKSIMGDRK